MKALIAAFTLPLCVGAHAACDWSAPGAARYRGNTTAAIDNYVDLSADVRAALKAKISARPRQHDDVVTITRDAIRGASEYADLRDMHWLKGLCRGAVNRSAWRTGASEGGMVYCVGPACVIVPAVCGNVARVTRVERRASAASGDPGHQVAQPPTDEIAMDPPSAGTEKPDEMSSFARKAELPLDPPAKQPDPWRRPIFVPWVTAVPIVVMDTPASPVPEAPKFVLLLAGLVLLAALTTRKKKRC